MESLLKKFAKAILDTMYDNEYSVCLHCGVDYDPKPIFDDEHIFLRFEDTTIHKEDCITIEAKKVLEQ